MLLELPLAGKDTRVDLVDLLLADKRNGGPADHVYDSRVSS